MIDENIVESLQLKYYSSNDESIINSRIESLLNTNNLFSEQMKKMNIYRTEFYNLFIEPKTKWLVNNNHIRLYIREDFDDSQNHSYTHYIPIGYVTDIYPIESSNKNDHTGIIETNIYPEIIKLFEDFYINNQLNTDKYSIGYISCGNDIVAITLKHINIIYDSKDSYIIHCNKLIKFADDYILKNKLI